MRTHLGFEKWGLKGMSNCLEETGIMSKKKPPTTMQEVLIFLNLIKNINEAIKLLLTNKKTKRSYLALRDKMTNPFVITNNLKKGFTQPYKPKEAFMIIKNTQEINPRGIYVYYSITTP
jgi:hypothetical protein